MNNYMKSLRVALTLLATVLAFGVVVWHERRSLAADLLLAEERAVTLRLLQLKGTEVVASRRAPVADEDSEKLDDAWQVYETFSKISEVEGLGQLNLEQPWTLYRETAMIGGGRLYFASMAQLSEPEQKLIDAQEFQLPDCESTTPPTTASDGTQRRPFRLAIEVASNEQMPSALARPHHFHVIITNTDQLYLPAKQVYCREPGQLSVYLPEDLIRNRLERKSSDDLKSEILRYTTKWGATSQEPHLAYLQLRNRFELDRVKLPILGVDVSGQYALVFLTFLAVGVAAWCSFLLRNLTSYNPAAATDEPWFLIEPLVLRSKVTGMGRVLASLELVVFLAGVSFVLATPLLLGAVVTFDRAESPGVPWPLIATGLLLSTVFGVSMFVSAWKIVRTAWRFQPTLEDRADDLSCVDI